MRRQVIGEVTLEILPSKQKATYSDGPAEDTLLSLFSGELNRQDVDQNASWPLMYHLDPRREGIIDWYPFEASTRVLEVGAGCGAITGALVAQSIAVTALELSEKRARIIAHRHKNAANLTVIAGLVADFRPEVQFDYVVCIGVLEYASLYDPAPDAHGRFLSNLTSFLKPGGKILVGIENQVGFKYLAGAREDHTGAFMDGLNDYPSTKTPRTFGQHELEQLFSEAGFESSYFYYPFPDYKFPALIYSDDYHPGQDGVHFPRNFLPTPAPDQDRAHVFSEAAFMAVIERNNLFKKMANSFLVEAVKR